MIPVNDTAAGATFAVKVHPRARKNAITGTLGTVAPFPSTGEIVDSSTLTSRRVTTGCSVTVSPAPLGTPYTARQSDLPGHRTSATPGGGTLSPALTAAPAGAVLSEHKVVGRQFMAVAAAAWRQDSAPGAGRAEKREY